MPFPGVSVTVKGTTVGISTDLNGKYTLNVPTNATTLVFSFIGFKTKEVEITGNVIDAVIDPDTQELEEVIVVAYGTATKSSFTGSATSVKAEKLQKLQTSSITKALEGIAPGIQVTSFSGQPGEDATIRIRGIGSINASSNPLYVVDGVPYGGTLSSINPSDIESVSVLKDAAANSLYGSRAANGVIMITTKKGTKGASKITFESRLGVNSRGVNEYDIVTDPGKYYELSWEALRNQNLYQIQGLLPINVTQANLDIANLYATNNLVTELGNYNNYNVADNQVVLTDGMLNPAASLKYKDSWHDEMFRNQVRQEYQLSFTGGTEKSTHFLSFGYLSDKGYVINSDYQRITGRANFDFQIYDWIKVGANAAYARDAQNFPNTSGSAYANVFSYSRSVPVIYPVYLRDIDGNYVLDSRGEKLWDFGGDPIYDAAGNVVGNYSRKYSANSNPVATTALDINENLYEVISLRPYIEVRFLKDFKFTTNISVDSRNYRGTYFQNPFYGDAASTQGRSTKDQQNYIASTFNQLLNWNKRINDHDFGVLLGHESYMTRSDYLTGQKSIFFNPYNPELSNGIVVGDLNSYVTETRQESYFSQLTYNYGGKYFASASFRTDGSSRFHPDYRWGQFWSVGGAWLIGKEEFMQGVSFVNDLKLKASYGINGNNDLRTISGAAMNFGYQDQFNIVPVGNGAGIQIYEYKGNKELTWEKSKNLNIGFEGNFFGRLLVEFDYFRKYTDDLLFIKGMAPSSGYRYFPLNVGDMVNSGVEGQFTLDLVKQKDITWNVSVNFTHYKNEIVRLPDYIKNLGDGGVLRPNGLQKLFEGGGINDFWLNGYAGVDPATGRPMYYMIGSQGQDSAQFSTSNLGNHLRNKGTAIPDLFGGISSNFTYKGFDFSFAFSYQLGGLVFDGAYQGLMSNDVVGGGNYHKDILNRWTLDNTNTDVPYIINLDQTTGQTSDRWLKDASFFNLRNITMGYNIPVKKMLPTAPVSGMRVYVVADNVYLWSKRKGMDPRQDISGSLGNNYSPIRTISGGISLTF